MIVSTNNKKKFIFSLLNIKTLYLQLLCLSLFRIKTLYVCVYRFEVKLVNEGNNAKKVCSNILLTTRNFHDKKK